MVGGDISGFTSVLTTTIANKTAKGNITLNMALAKILFIVVFGITLTVNFLQKRREWA
jgi:ABC-type tungstate transport system substrate-binding protein